MQLTIGMASYRNFQEVWFTIQNLRMYHDLTDTEIVVIDNAGDDDMQAFFAAWMPAQVRYVRYTARQGTAAPRDQVFAEARGEWVLVIDSHVLLAPGAVAEFRQWSAAHPDCLDLLQGPMLYDDQRQMADAFQDKWEGEMWGVWRNAAVDPAADPYEIEMMGLGLFACRRDAWLGFHPEFAGFGGEEGYIHTKYRQAGRRTLCLPFLRWLHYFHTRAGVVTAPYTPQRADKIHNYLLGFAELGLDPAPIRAHFGLPAPPPLITNIQIDPNAHCGSRCWFCPVRYVERPAGQVMPQALFEQILDNIQDAVQQGRVAPDFTLWLSSYNDILLDPLLPERLEALRVRQMRFACLSNGIGLLQHAPLLDRYRDVVPCYSINLPAGDPESYAAHSGNPPELFATIIAGLRALHAQDPEHYARTVHIGINGAGDEDWSRAQLLYDLPLGDTDRQLRQLQELLPMFTHIEAMRPLCDRAGHLASHAIDNRRNPGQWHFEPGAAQGCNRLTEWVHINSAGQVYACCQDYREEYVVGSVTEMGLTALIAASAPIFERCRQELCEKCVFSS